MLDAHAGQTPCKYQSKHELFPYEAFTFVWMAHKTKSMYGVPMYTAYAPVIDTVRFLCFCGINRMCEDRVSVAHVQFVMTDYITIIAWFITRENFKDASISWAITNGFIRAPNICFACSLFDEFDNINLSYNSEKCSIAFSSQSVESTSSAFGSQTIADVRFCECCYLYERRNTYIQCIHNGWHHCSTT